MRVLSAVRFAGRRRSGGWVKRAALGVAALAAAAGLPLAVAASASASVGVINSIPVGGNPQGVAVDSTSGTVYVADGPAVLAINEAANTVTPIPLPESPGASTVGVAVGFGNVYVTNSDGTVFVISETSNSVAPPIPVGNGPTGIAVDPVNHKVYVANQVDGSVSVIDATSNSVAPPIPVGNGPTGVAVDPNTGNVWVTNQTSGSVSLINPGTTVGPVPTFPVGGAPNGITFDPKTPPGNVYIANAGPGGVSVMGAAGGQVTGNIGVGNAPTSVAVDPTAGNVYVTNNGDNTVSVISDTTNTVTATIPVDTNPNSHPNGVAADPTTGNVYVTNSDGTVSVIGTVTTSPSPTPSPTPSSSPTPTPSPSSSNSSGAVTATENVNELVSLSGLSGTVIFPPAAAGSTATVTGAEAYTAFSNDPAGYTLTLGASGAGLTSAFGSIPNTDLTVTETGISPAQQLTFGAPSGAMVTIAKTAKPSSDSYTENWALAIPASATAATYSESFVYLVLGN